MKIIEVIENELKKLNFDISVFPNDFIEFNGKKRDDNGNDFSVEGSIEVDENESVSFSVLFYDETNDIEYDGLIGTYYKKGNNWENVIKEYIDDLMTPNFVELA